jgi:hypothetical protein
MKSKKVLFMALVVALMTTACGSGGFSPERLPKSDVFGNIPSIVYAKMQQDSVIRAKGLTEMQNAGDNEAKAKKIFEKYQEQYEAAEAKFKNDIEEEIATLNGKEIPFSQDESMGYEVTEVGISEVTTKGDVEIGFRVKITDASKLKLSFPWANLNGNFPCPVQLLDKAGEITKANRSQYVYFLKHVNINGEVRSITNASEMKNGYDFYQVTSFKINEDNAQAYANVAKVHFPQHN